MNHGPHRPGPRVQEALQTRLVTMIAVPLYFLGECRGVGLGHYATSRVVKHWSCGGPSSATCDDTLASQVFTCAVCGQVNQL